ncbi:MAG: protein kinase [Cyanobacteria bacterium P01_H01_bin.152]
MAKVIAIGQPINDAERLVIAYLRDHLPDTYTLVHNFEITRYNQDFEVDIALLAPHAVYLIDVKGTRGTINVYGSKWYPEGRQPFTSPLLKLKGHARAFKGLITDSNPARPEINQLYVDAVIVLPAPDATLNDDLGKDKKATTPLKRAERFFKDSTRMPNWAERDIRGFHRLVLNALQANSRPISSPKQFGDWSVLEDLGGIEGNYNDYRVYSTNAGPNSGTALLRAYEADPYITDPDEKAQQQARIKNAYIALNRMPPHPNILGVKGFFASEMEDAFYLVTDDVPGNVLKLYFDKPDLALTYDQKLKIAQDIFSALHYAHRHHNIHRNLNPSAVLVGTNGQTYLIDFDYARTGTQRSHTIAGDITEQLDKDYLAPECQGGNLAAASPASDVFAAGLLLYELFTGQKPFDDPSDCHSREAIFPVKPSDQEPDLPTGFDDWLQSLCTFAIQERPTAKQAWTQLRTLIREAKAQPAKPKPEPPAIPPEPTEPPVELDYRNLAPDTQLGRKFRVEKKLGEGTFGVVYQVIDTLADMRLVIKIILKDRYSVIERLKKEFRPLRGLPDHPNVVKVFYPDFLPNEGPPFIAFAYVEGIDVKDMVKERLFSPDDGLRLALDVAAGLDHIHNHDVCHCDIKPSNLLWTDEGAKIIDFNVSVQVGRGGSHGGGSLRYLPPDLDLDSDAQKADLVDRDLYALGVTLYEVITGYYPWETAQPPAGQPAKDPREYSGLTDLAPELADLMLKLIAPKKCDRFQTAANVLHALQQIQQARRLPPPPETDVTLSHLGREGETGNPFVSYLVTLYSQSHRSNAGTRGLDALGNKTYVNTLLDDELLPAVLQGEFRLVIITGNAGDGKTAFLQKLELYAAEQGGILDHRHNGCRMEFDGRTYLSNYDGSQDEGEQTNDAVLDAFFAPFAGAAASQWHPAEVRLIAINEGRLIDFLASRGETFSQLKEVVSGGLQTGLPEAGVAILNLNLRSVVAEVPDRDGSILERQLRKLTHPTFWEACKTCEIADRCYALHNAQTFQDPTAGEKVVERIKTLYTLTHLRNRLHITLRDLRSALSYLLVSDRTCEEIKLLYNGYATGAREAILDSYYFNSWRGGEGENSDRLLTLLKDVDIGNATDARLDRELDFMAPVAGGKRFTFEQRSNFDQQIFTTVFEELPRDFSGIGGRDRFDAHRRYVASLRRRYFFEQRAEGWQRLLPYRSATTLLELLQSHLLPDHALPRVLSAINRGEGLTNPERLQGDLALQVREVENGTIRSYRIFGCDRFTLAIYDRAEAARFVEHMPSGLVLQHQGTVSTDAELIIDLDMFEMLERLNDGYRPSIEQTQGYYLSLVVFKNLLASAPYREVLLTTTGHDFYRVCREDSGQLQFDALDQEVAHGAV